MGYVESDDFIIEDLGILDIDVFDIEVEDNHNFFANNILVHNSNYIDLDQVVTKFIPNKNTQETVDWLDKFGREVLEPFMSKSYQELCDYINGYEQRMIMKRECIYESALWTGKKHYIMNIWDNEGVRYPNVKLKVTGMESIKSSTAGIARKKMNELYSIVLSGTNDDAIELIKDFKYEFKSKPLEEIAFPKGVNEIDKWIDTTNNVTISRTPIHVKASFHYNRLLKENDLLSDYPEIHEGDKIKFLYLKKLNPVNNNAIGFHTYLPKELDLERYIDKDIMYEKMFIKPAMSVLDACGWTTEKVITFDVF